MFFLEEVLIVNNLSMVFGIGYLFDEINFLMFFNYVIILFMIVFVCMWLISGVFSNLLCWGY